MTAKRKARLPGYRPKSNGNNDKFVDRVTRAGVKSVAVGSEDRHNPQVSVVQVQMGGNRQPRDFYYEPSNISTLFEPEIHLIPVGKKWCSACGEWVDKKGFTADKRNRDGLQSHCKSCHAAHERMMYWLRKVEKQGRTA